MKLMLNSKWRSSSIVLSLLVITSAWGQDSWPEAKPVSRMQVIPMPYHQASFQRDGVEITRYHFGPSLKRPFVFPVMGPSGRSLTRMNQPTAPESHSHHNSVWISHQDVGGTNFWGDEGYAKIRHRQIIEYKDGGRWSHLIAENEWVNGREEVLLLERRKVSVLLLEELEWLLVIQMQFRPNGKPITLGKTPFGMIGVRMAASIGVTDGGGRIRNSEGAVNEKGVFWKRARWVDYSGAVANEKIEGITLFDHPKNPNFPSYFHVRDNGWMGASLTFDGPRLIEPGKPLELCYGLYVHSDMKPSELIEAKWKQFTDMEQPQP